MKTSSYRRIRASRRNGRRSRGPQSAIGKLNSSQNAIRHGLLAKCVVLSGESDEGFENLLSQYVAQLQPTHEVERSFVDEMVAATWRLRRAWAIETRLLEQNIEDTPNTDDLGRIVAAFCKLAAGPELPLIHRYQTRLHRNFQHALQNFLILREVAVRNEPSPIIEHQNPPAIDVSKSPQSDAPACLP